jgi:hypothetical protein
LLALFFRTSRMITITIIIAATAAAIIIIGNQPIPFFCGVAVSVPLFGDPSIPPGSPS